jgi:1-phosphatidylinositol phosphodiesterase
MTDMNIWMKSVPDGRSLSELSIPGTHDTMTYNVGPLSGVGFVKCQTESLDEQLKRGIRCLDIRCRHINNLFTIHHGQVYLDLNFGEVLTSCDNFLKVQKSETILMFVKPEHEAEDCTRSFAETFRDYMETWGRLFCLDRLTPSLGAVRGKIVLLRRFDYEDVVKADPLGLDLSGWEDDKTFDLKTAGMTYHVQDIYDVGWKPNKLSAIRSLLDEAAKAGRSKNAWWINFTSGVGTRFYSPMTPASVAATMNPGLKAYLDDHPASHTGTVMMDFPFSQSGMVESIVARNF